MENDINKLLPKDEFDIKEEEISNHIFIVEGNHINKDENIKDFHGAFNDDAESSAGHSPTKKKSKLEGGIISEIPIKEEPHSYTDDERENSHQSCMSRTLITKQGNVFPSCSSLENENTCSSPSHSKYKKYQCNLQEQDPDPLMSCSERLNGISPSETKCWQYSTEYLAYGFIPSPQDSRMPMCLICCITLSNESMHPSKLLEHLETVHAEMKEQPLDYFKHLRDNFYDETTDTAPVTPALVENTSKAYRGLLVSYKIALLIAKSEESHDIGESLILPIFSAVCSTLGNENPPEITESIPLNSAAVTSRINEMAADVEMQLVEHLRMTEFTLHLDEVFVCANEAILVVYVRFLDEHEFRGEMLFVRNLTTTDPAGNTIFAEVKSYFIEKNIPLENIIACAIDGAASSVERYRGFISHLKKVIPRVLCVHCLVHSQSLVSKEFGEELYNTFVIVQKVIDSINSYPLQDSSPFRHENKEELEFIFTRTEVPWISKALHRLVSMWDTIVKSLNDKELAKQITNVKSNVFYLADIFEKLSFVSGQLQGPDCNLMSCKEVIVAFIKKLEAFQCNLKHHDMSEFPSLATLASDHIDDHINVYVGHLKQLGNDLKVRFHDLLKMEIPGWLEDPFDVDAADVEVGLQETLIAFQWDIAAHIRFQKERHGLWMSSEVTKKYPLLWEKAKLYLIAFPTSSLVESGFNQIRRLLPKISDPFDIAKIGDIRLFLTELQPNINKLASIRQSHV